MCFMSKLRHNFTLSNEAAEKLKDVDNKSQTVEKAIDYYFANKNRKEEKIIEIEPKNSSFRLKRVIV